MLKVTANGTNVVTGEVRLSYCNLFAPRPGPSGGEPRYSTAILIPKTDTETLKALKGALVDAGRAKWGDKFDSLLKAKQLRIPIRDGDVEKPEDAAYKGHYFINVSSKNRPQIVDRALQPITGPEQLRSGDYARVNVNAFGYDNKGKGVSFGLNNVQKIRDGEPLAGGPGALDVFDALGEATPAGADAKSDDGDFPF